MMKKYFLFAYKYEKGKPLPRLGFTKIKPNVVSGSKVAKFVNGEWVESALESQLFDIVIDKVEGHGGITLCKKALTSGPFLI
ncbi:hypothetical protein CBQ28_21980 [Pseudoalteromonas sp. GCY]|uniref:hypothetical protein n=1 Tax=Pseudoalteromonas sp. GCY TaxID=2003316 RepID=UPI000BFEAD2C|nr:hypothetical protein [Pseudoalteromonas sp. GCY]PHI35018.1 hypothetical protein CBQ28_21980 [Pseudoalteromonas sp. GCY]QQQ68165.1 hypothetical protein JJQ94_10335 [Pseudoalteromonas sp. GCY]